MTLPCGKLDAILGLKDENDILNIETQNEASSFSKVRSKTLSIIEQKLYEIKHRNKSISFDVLNKATDIINYFVFNCKDKEWSRFILILHSYVDWLYAHSINTAIICYIIGSELGYNLTQLSNLCIAALLHDIGKTLLPKDVLIKRERLTDIEYAIIKNHSQMGSSLLQGCGLQPIVSQIVLQHHERIDGSGYPNGLQKDEILEESSILIAAEYLDTETTFRPYKNARPVDDVLYEMKLKDSVFPRYIVDILDS